MQSRLLRSFLVVAEKGNITQAAETLNVSQPALTKTIRRLEDDLGAQLFERVSTGVCLTRFGDILLQHANAMDNQYRHAVSRIEALRDGGLGELRIGGGPVWLASILPPIVARFLAQFPGVKLSLIGGTIDTLVPALVADELDLICVSLDFPNRSEIVKQPLFDVRHVLVADPRHQLVQAATVDAESMHAFPWIVLKSDYVGTERIASFFAVNGLTPPSIAMETTSINSLLGTLKSGTMIAHIPSQLLTLARSFGLVEIQLPATFWETSAGIAYRASARMVGPFKDFVTLIKNSSFD